MNEDVKDLEEVEGEVGAVKTEVSDVTKPEEIYPTTLNVNKANVLTVKMVRQHKWIKSVAEIGIYRGHTSLALAKILAKRGGTLHLFDFEDMIEPVAKKVREATDCRVVEHPNARKLMDSYNWSLMKLIKKRGSGKATFDYVFLDGSHTWNHDALAFFLIDRLLRTKGYIDFDDYTWTMARSPSISQFGPASDWYTTEQLKAPHVKLVVDLLVRTNKRYKQIHSTKKNQIFQKIR